MGFPHFFSLMCKKYHNFVRRNQYNTKNPTIPQNTQPKMSRPCTALPPAALPSLSMATSAMDPNRGAAAPYESVWGAERAPIEKLGDGRSTGLGWPPLDDDTRQPTERWRRQWGGAWERRHDREERVREDVYPSFRGVKCSNEKVKIERATGP